MKKKTVIKLILAGLSMVTFCAQAGDLHITNNTKSPSTTIANGGLCSSWLGSVGITQPGEQDHVVPESKIKMACVGNTSNCKAAVYLSDNCKGDSIATVTFDVATGIKDITFKPGYKVTGSGFHISLDPA